MGTVVISFVFQGLEFLSLFLPSAFKVHFGNCDVSGGIGAAAFHM